MQVLKHDTSYVYSKINKTKSFELLLQKMYALNVNWNLYDFIVQYTICCGNFLHFFCGMW